MKLVKNTKPMNEDQKMDLLASDSSKSEKMRDLFDAGEDIKDIAHDLDVRYNFVYNVVSRHILKQGIPEENIEKNSNAGSNLKEEIIALLKEDPDMKVSEIAKTLNKNYNYVWKLHKEVTNG